MALLMWGGQVHIISTHDGVDNPFNELITDIRAGKKPYSIHRITFDEAVSDGLYRRICLRLGKEWTADGEAAWCKEIRDFYGDDASEELDCIPKNGGGKWLNRALIESRMSPYTPVIRYDQSDEFGLLPEPRRAAEVADWIADTLQPLLDGLDKTRVSFVGEDFARSGDRTVIVPLLQQTNLSLKPPFVLELGNMPFAQQEQIMKHLLHGLSSSPSCSWNAASSMMTRPCLPRRFEGRLDKAVTRQPEAKRMTKARTDFLSSPSTNTSSVSSISPAAKP